MKHSTYSSTTIPDQSSPSSSSSESSKIDEHPVKKRKYDESELSLPSDSLVCRCGFTHSDLLVPSSIISKPVSIAFDVVVPSSKSTCCFTKAYSRMVEGTGSIILTNPSSLETCNRLDFAKPRPSVRKEEDVQEHPDFQQMQTWDGRLRYFCSLEIALLHGFPPTFSFPPNLSRRKSYQLLGNSLSAHIIAYLLQILYTPHPWPS